MAIDTAPKRKSVAGVSVGWGVTPDATPGVEWRQQVGWSYSGIAPDAGPTGGYPLLGVLGGFMVVFGNAFTLADNEED